MITSTQVICPHCICRVPRNSTINANIIFLGIVKSIKLLPCTQWCSTTSIEFRRIYDIKKAMKAWGISARSGRAIHPAYSGFWDVLTLPASTSSSGTLSYLLPSLSPDLGVCDSTCFTHVYQIDPPRIIAIEEARPLRSIRLVRKHAETSTKHLRGDHITKQPHAQQ